MRTLLTGATLVDPAAGGEGRADVLIEEERIARIGRDITEPVDRQIDAGGLWLIPGLVDLCARLGEPGYSRRGTIDSETRAAAAGGFTRLACPPDCHPVLDRSSAVRHLHDRASESAHVHLAPLGALTAELDGKRLSDMAALKRHGCSAVSDGLAPVADSHVLRCALQYAASLDLTVFLTPLDPWLGGGCAHEGRTSTRLGLPTIPVAAETAAVARYLALVRDTGTRVHIGRLSSAAAVELIAEARREGLPVSADVAAHQLFLSDLDLVGFDANCHVSPPLRDQSDREALRRAVADGTVEAICSDHMPRERDAKLAPFPETAPGIAALETALGLGLRLVEEKLLDLPTLLTRMSSAPAEILGVEGGRLSEGAPADLCLIDPEQVWTLSADAMLSQARNTPFEGWEFRGRVVRTIVAGETVFQREG